MRNAASNRNIVLVGPMGSGKSHVGRLLATRLGLGFADVDAGVEADAGMPIPAIFAREGEAGFRAREARILAGILAGADQVVATGGGAVLRCLGASGSWQPQCKQQIQYRDQGQGAHVGFQ